MCAGEEEMRSEGGEEGMTSDLERTLAYQRLRIRVSLLSALAMLAWGVQGYYSAAAVQGLLWVALDMLEDRRHEREEKG